MNTRKNNPHAFVGRDQELVLIEKIAANRPAILVVHGRRRIGKTRLIEHTFSEESILKFEGLEGISKREQIKTFFLQLNTYLKKHDQANLQLSTSLIDKISPSMGWYNRSQYELPLQHFSLEETKHFLGPKFSLQNVMDAYLLVGGIPEYLKYLSHDSSIYLSLAANSFAKGAFFRSECDKIFISSLSENPNYKKIVKFQAKRKFATRYEILNFLNLESGSNTTQLLEDPEMSGLISKHTPYDKPANSKLSRYEIADPYLQFYYKFIEPKAKLIDNGDFYQNPMAALSLSALDQWLGYSFERFCRNHGPKIAHILGFGAVSYTYGPYFNRATSLEDKSYQLDLVFDRKDKVISVCEIKYTRTPATANHANEFLEKMELFKPKQRSLQTVLICNQRPTKEVTNGRYFDRIITIDDLFSSGR